MYCLKLFKASELTKNNNNPEPRNHQFIIAEELLKLLLNLADWQKPVSYKYRDAISPAVLHSIVCKIKPRYKLVIISTIFLTYINYSVKKITHTHIHTHTLLYIELYIILP